MSIDDKVGLFIPKFKTQEQIDDHINNTEGMYIELGKLKDLFITTKGLIYQRTKGDIYKYLTHIDINSYYDWVYK